MDDLKSFSFKDATMNECPIADMEYARNSILDSIEKLIKAPKVTEKCIMNYNKTKPSMLKLLDALFLLLQSPNLDQEEEVVNSILSSLDSLRLSWLESDENVNVYGNYVLNISCIPKSLLFYKHLVSTNFISNNRRTNRITLENEYKLWVGRCDYCYRFSHVLFALSWMNFLLVQNNSNVHFNSNPPIYI